MPLNSCTPNRRYEKKTNLIEEGENGVIPSTTWSEKLSLETESDKGDFCQVVDDLRNEVDQLVKRNTHLEQKLIEREQDVAKLNCRLKKQNVSLQSKDQEIGNLRERQVKLQQIIDLLNKDREEGGAGNNSDTIIRQLEDTVENLKQQVQEMESTMKCWQEENELRKQDLSATQARLESTYEEMDEMGYKLKRYKVGLKTLEQENGDLQSHLYQMECDQAKERANYSKLLEKVEKLQTYRKQLVNENETLLKNLDYVVNEYTSYRKYADNMIGTNENDIGMCMNENEQEEEQEQEDEEELANKPRELGVVASDGHLAVRRKTTRMRNMKCRSMRARSIQPRTRHSCRKKSMVPMQSKKAMAIQSRRGLKTNNHGRQLNERKTIMFTVFPPAGSVNITRKYRKRGNVGYVCKKGPSRRMISTRKLRSMNVVQKCR